MKYSRLGRSNLKVSRICLGTMHFGGRATEDESFRIMDRALELGMTFFDTANVYGISGDVGYRGLSEEIIGRWLKASVPSDSIRMSISSFANAVFDFCC